MVWIQKKGLDGREGLAWGDACDGLFELERSTLFDGVEEIVRMRGEVESGGGKSALLYCF
jgi:hypothetical protein